LSRKIADIYLAGELKSTLDKSVSKQIEIKIDPKILDAYVGDYALSPTFILTFTKENDQLMAQASGQPKFPVFPSSENTFFWKVVDAQFTFDKPTESGAIAGGVHHQNGRDTPAKRIDRAGLRPAKECEGDFYSDELNVIYTFMSRDGKLVLRFPRGDVLLSQTASNAFTAGFPVGAFQFTRSANNDCNGFTINDGRVQKLHFDKVRIMPLEMAH
ncbi:MAG: hypothetical protein QOF03_51, partial [Alphaproteobacteria bacterium]|nr:hypothetical protein [Alphaproteobacteria bacterium]